MRKIRDNVRRRNEEETAQKEQPSNKREREEEDEVEEEDNGMELAMYNKKKEQTGVMIVSTCDYAHLSLYKHYKDGGGYAACSHPDIGGRVHNYIIKKLMGLDVPDGYVVDHINSEHRLDNRRSNLRVVSYLQNAQNRRKKVNTNTDIPQSIYNNVKYDKKSNKWLAGFSNSGIRVSMGSYNTEIEAACAFDCFVWHNRDSLGLNHRLNFPEKDYRSMIPYKRKIKSYKGICKDGNGYRARVSVNNKNFNIGTFKTEVEAALAYDAYVVEHDIPQKKLNFPEEHPTYDSRQIKTEKEDCGDDIHCYLRSNRKDVNAKNIKISISDYERVKYYSICIFGERPHITVNGKLMMLYRFILDVTDPKIQIEHRPDPNPFNCSRNNLHKGSAQTNACFMQPRKGKTLVGVSKGNNRFRARINVGKLQIFDKSYNFEEDAARARDLFILSRSDIPPKWMNFDDWEQPGVKESWQEKLQMK